MIASIAAVCFLLSSAPLVCTQQESAAADASPYAGSPIQAHLEAADARLAAIAAIPAKDRTKENTLLALDGAVARFFEDARFPGFMADVSTSTDERDRGRDAQKDMSNWFDSVGQNAELFRALTELEALAPELTPEQQQYFDDTMREYRRAGLDLEDAQRDRIAELDEELNDLGSDFRANIADDATFLLLTEEELEGVPARFLRTLPKPGGLYMVTLKGSALGYVLGYCEVESTRQKMGIAAGRRGGQANVDILETMLRLRHERAQILGYPNYATYETESKMAGSPSTVAAFYAELQPKLRKKALADFDEYQDAKREHLGDTEATLRAADIAYYTNWLKREKYAVDTRKLREYFPMGAVQDGMFGVYQDLFGITFTEITDKAREEGRPMWHEDVQLYRVDDNASGKMLGEFYLDLFPRDGKYTHAAQFPLRLRKVWNDGRVSTPLVALVCNFTKPTADQPSLLPHAEVKTFFHEFGHCLHSILTEATIANLAGTNVARDFVEAPSQMLENWTWEPAILARFARHYETGAPLPADIIEGMVAAKNLGSGMNTEGQVYLGLMDMRFHSSSDGEVDTTAVCEATYRESRLFEPAEHLVRQASFGHLVGYESGYYGYLWSLVYAQDMWSMFQAEPMNHATAMRYRRAVLAPGGGRDALDLVRDFLGREPNSDAFLASLGLE